MKKLILIILSAMLFFSLQAFAQKEFAIDKGSILLGGSAGYTSSGGEIVGDDRRSTIFVNPSMVFFVAPGFGLGGDISVTSVSVGGETETSFGLGPTLALFFGTAESSTYPYLKGSYFYTTISDRFTENKFRFSGGSAFMIAYNVAITAEGFYLTQKFKANGSTESVSGNTFGIQVGIAAFIF